MKLKNYFKKLLGIDAIESATNKAIEQMQLSQTATNKILEQLGQTQQQQQASQGAMTQLMAQIASQIRQPIVQSQPDTNQAQQPPTADDKDRIIAGLQEQLETAKKAGVDEFFANFSQEVSMAAKSGPGRPALPGEITSLKLDYDLSRVLDLIKERFKFNKSEYLNRKIREGIEKDYPDLLAELYRRDGLAARAATQRRKD